MVDESAAVLVQMFNVASGPALVIMRLASGFPFASTYQSTNL